MQIKKASILKAAIVMFFVALLEPNGILYSPLHGLMGLLRYAAFFLSVILIITDRLYRERIPMLMLAFVIWIGFTTYMYRGEINDSYLYIFRTLFSGIVLSVFCIKNMPRFYIYMMGIIFSLWLLLDGVTWKEAGTYLTETGQRAFFLGTKTTITYYLMPGLAFSFLAREIASVENRRYVTFLSIMAIGGSVLYLIREPISTAIICLLLGTVVWYVIDRQLNMGRLVCAHGFWTTSLLNVLLISGNILGLFANFFTNVLGEDVHLNGRTQIWNLVLNYIRQKPLTGYGYSSGIRFDVWQSYNSSTHNFFLNLLFMGGIIGFAIYICIVIAIHVKNRVHMQDGMARYLMFLLVVMNVEGITENYGFNVMTFVFMIMLCYLDIFIDCRDGYDVGLF